MDQLADEELAEFPDDLEDTELDGTELDETELDETELDDRAFNDVKEDGE
jgi:hypothetical protein